MVYVYDYSNCFIEKIIIYTNYQRGGGRNFHVEWRNQESEKPTNQGA